MPDKWVTILPELAVLGGACVCLLIGLGRSLAVHRLTVWVAGVSLVIAGGLTVWAGAPGDQTGGLVWSVSGFVKLAICVIGLLLLLVAAGLPSGVSSSRGVGGGLRGEFFAFFLFSLTGAMLCADAEDLVWLFLALELTSLPTYVMVAVSRNHVGAQEAAVKYFYLGAMAAALFLYGFTLIYGATGSTEFRMIRAWVNLQAAGGTEVSLMLITGFVLAVVGVSFKIAAVPMHFYVADVYQGAALPVAAYLAFVPKVAGFVAMIGLIGLLAPLASGQLQPIAWVLAGLAVLTMTVGNALGVLQTNVKRVMAYSSVAHTGYMLLGLVSLAAAGVSGDRFGLNPSVMDGTAALLFYLVAYGLATVGVFAVLGSVRSGEREVETFDDIAGLGRRHPLLGAVMLVSVLSLIGLPPMVGFLGKVYLFGSAISHGYTWVVVIAVINSAVSAVYYLRIVSACFFDRPRGQFQVVVDPARRFGAVTAALGAVVFGFAGGPLVDAARRTTIPKHRVGHVTVDSGRSLEWSDPRRPMGELTRVGLFNEDLADRGDITTEQE